MRSTRMLGRQVVNSSEATFLFILKAMYTMLPFSFLVRVGFVTVNMVGTLRYFWVLWGTSG